MGPYQATGSSSGFPEMSRNRIPSSPACTVFVATIKEYERAVARFHGTFLELTRKGMVHSSVGLNLTRSLMKTRLSTDVMRGLRINVLVGNCVSFLVIVYLATAS